MLKFLMDAYFAPKLFEKDGKDIRTFGSSYLQEVPTDLWRLYASIYRTSTPKLWLFGDAQALGDFHKAIRNSTSSFLRNNVRTNALRSSGFFFGASICSESCSESCSECLPDDGSTLQQRKNLQDTS